MGRIYLIYAVSFVTRKGTKRTYVGYTPSLDLRRFWHRQKPPAWMKAAGKTAVFKYEILEDGIPSKCAALAAEALWAARRIWRHPDLVRGGPWVKPTLTPDMLSEICTVAACKAFMTLSSLADANPAGLLHKHLQDLAFSGNTDAFRGADIVWGKNRSGSTGEPGNQSRKKQLARGILAWAWHIFISLLI